MQEIDQENKAVIDGRGYGGESGCWILDTSWWIIDKLSDNILIVMPFLNVVKMRV